MMVKILVSIDNVIYDMFYNGGDDTDDGRCIIHGDDGSGKKYDGHYDTNGNGDSNGVNDGSNDGNEVWSVCDNDSKENRSRMIMDTDEDDYFLEPEYGYEDLTFLEACMDNDLDAIAAIVDDSPTEEEINERDRCGRTGLSHLCSAGLTPALEMLIDVPELDVNLPDKEGNTPLILAAQADTSNGYIRWGGHMSGGGHMSEGGSCLKGFTNQMGVTCQMGSDVIWGQMSYGVTCQMGVHMSYGGSHVIWGVTCQMAHMSEGVHMSDGSHMSYQMEVT
ncbi:Ankyrin repeat domain-containing protein 33B [Bulinus truncatus]|nr:Ankyrin repeat domain-containing protein 33B [Bulinus truncatus]